MEREGFRIKNYELKISRGSKQRNNSDFYFTCDPALIKFDTFSIQNSRYELRIKNFKEGSKQRNNSNFYFTRDPALIKFDTFNLQNS